MRRLAFILLFIFIAAISNSQNSTTTYNSRYYSSKKDTLTIISKPKFTGGKAFYHRFLADNLHWPKPVNHISGEIHLAFNVEENGQLTNIHIVQGLSPELDAEALRVIGLSPPWIPAKVNQKPVRYYYRLHINYKATLPTVIPSPSNQKITIYEPVDGGQRSIKADTITVYAAVQQEPTFPGGMAKFYKYIDDHKKLSDTGFVAKRREIVTFIVERNGTLSNIKVLRGISDEYDQDALRLIKESPKWIPGMQGGIIVRVQYTISISYNILQ